MLGFAVEMFHGIMFLRKMFLGTGINVPRGNVVKGNVSDGNVWSNLLKKFIPNRNVRGNVC